MKLMFRPFVLILLFLIARSGIAGAAQVSKQTDAMGRDYYLFFSPLFDRAR